jgi:Lon protease-like protein
MSTLHEIPLFPLNTVLFPGMPLPLHIFEDRYKGMINQSIQEATPFGVVLIREGAEVGDTAIPYDVGTSAFVTQVERLPDGRMNINTVGYPWMVQKPPLSSRK